MRIERKLTAMRYLSGIAFLLLGAFSGCSSSPEERTKENLDRAFDEGVNRKPTAETLYSMSKILAAQGKEGTYEYTLSRIIEQYPRFMPAYCDLAELRVRQKRIEEAMDIVEDGLAEVPQDPILLNNLGMCRLLRGDYELAGDAFRRAAVISPDDARYRANLAASLGLLGRYEESYSLYAQLMPADDAHHNVAVLAETRLDVDRAAKEYRKAEEAAQATRKREGIFQTLVDDDTAVEPGSQPQGF